MFVSRYFPPRYFATRVFAGRYFGGGTGLSKVDYFSHRYYSARYFADRYFPGNFVTVPPTRVTYYPHNYFAARYFADRYFPGPLFAPTPVPPSPSVFGSRQAIRPRVEPIHVELLFRPDPFPELAIRGRIQAPIPAPIVQPEPDRTVHAVLTVEALVVVTLSVKGSVVAAPKRRKTSRRADDDAEENALLEHYLLSLYGQE